MEFETHWLLLGIGFLFAVLSMPFLFTKEKEVDYRKKQSESLFRENIISKAIDDIVEKNIKKSKRVKVEALCIQAGIPMKYIELFTISLISSLFLGVVIGYLTNNVFMGAVLAVAGFLMPKQVIVFVRNRRVEKMGEQIGSFMHMVLSRYESTGLFSKSIELSTKEFVGEEPLYSELKKTVMDIQLGVPTTDAMDNLALRTGNVYLQRMSDYYRIALDVGTEDARTNLMKQAYLQYDENRKTKQLMRKELSTVKRDAYIMLATIPIVGLFQVMVNEDYIRFMTQDPLGQIGLGAITIVFIGSLWFINNKISAPLE